MEKTIISRQYKLFRERLRAARISAGLSQAQLAVLLGETQSFVSKCERGERRLDFIEVQIFCAAIGIPLFFLLGGDAKSSGRARSAEELLELPETLARLENTTDGTPSDIARLIKRFHAKTSNYQPGIFYHATGGIGESGLGRGLYVGKDRRALDNFYNMDGGQIETYMGNPRFLDLTDYEEFAQFAEQAQSVFGKLPCEDHLRLLTLAWGFDGIRYYDPEATGEEFVVYNANALDRIAGKQTRRRRDAFIFD